jgi:hypothetical protein
MSVFPYFDFHLQKTGKIVSIDVDRIRAVIEEEKGCTIDLGSDDCYHVTETREEVIGVMKPYWKPK